MAVRQLIYDLLARDKTGPATKSAADNIDDIGDSAKSSARHLDKLDHEISNVERELHGLARAWVEAGTAAERADLSKSIRSTQRELKQLEKNKGILSKILPGDGDTDRAGKSFATKLVGSIGGGLTSISGTLGSSVGPTVGGAIGVAAAPVLLSTLGAGITALAGAGIIGAGIYGVVSHDPGVGKAGQQLAERLMIGFQESSDVLRGPVLKAMDVVADAGDRVVKNLGSTFSELSDDIVPFTSQVTRAAEAMTGGLLAAARNSGPSLDALGDSLVLIGDSAGKFFETISEGGPEAADNLRLIAGALSDTVQWTGELIKVMSQLSANPILTGPLLPLLREHYKGAADAASELPGPTDDAATATEKFSSAAIAAKAAAEGQTDAVKELQKALRAEVDPVFGLITAEDNLTKAKKDAATASKKYGADSDQAEAANRKLALAAIDLRGRVDELGDTFSGQLSPTLLQTLRGAGLTEAQIADLGRQFTNTRKDAQSLARNWKVGLSTSGFDTATGKVRTLKQELKSMKTNWNVTIRQHFLTFGKPYSQAGIASGHVGGLAGGGPVQGPGPKGVDSELRLLAPGEYVLSAGEVDAMGGQAAVSQWRKNLTGIGSRPRAYAPVTMAAHPALAGGGMTSAGGGGGGGWIEVRSSDALIAQLTKMIASHVAGSGSGRAATLGIRVI